MINVRAVRRWMASVSGPMVAIGKDQLEQLLAEVESGRQAKRDGDVDTVLTSLAR